jgi:excisionase family DNA binding protein
METNGRRRTRAETTKRQNQAAARRRTAQLMDIVSLEAESGISRYTWRDWIRTRQIESLKLGRGVRVHREVYEAFLQANRVKAR